MLRRSLLHSFALDVFLLLLRRPVVIKSVMFRLRVTRLNFPIIYYLFVLLFAVFGVVVVVVFFFSRHGLKMSHE